jgi:excisionase family DNA binding protein
MPHEAAALCGVTQKTLARWAISGNLPFTTTMGGHRRYAYADVMALLAVQRTTVHLPPRRSS